MIVLSKEAAAPTLAAEKPAYIQSTSFQCAGAVRHRAGVASQEFDVIDGPEVSGADF